MIYSQLVYERPNNFDEFAKRVRIVAGGLADALIDESDPSVNCGDSAKSEEDEEDQNEEHKEPVDAEPSEASEVSNDGDSQSDELDRVS